MVGHGSYAWPVHYFPWYSKQWFRTFTLSILRYKKNGMIREDICLLPSQYYLSLEGIFHCITFKAAIVPYNVQPPDAHSIVVHLLQQKISTALRCRMVLLTVPKCRILHHLVLYHTQSREAYIFEKKIKIYSRALLYYSTVTSYTTIPFYHNMVSVRTIPVPVNNIDDPICLRRTTLNVTNGQYQILSEQTFLPGPRCSILNVHAYS